MAVLLTFYSDTNLGNAMDELEMLELASLRREGDSLVVSSGEFNELAEPISSIVNGWGGVIEV